MPCTVVNSQSQLQARLANLPATLPATQGQWTAFLNVLNQWGQVLQNDQQPINVIPARYSLFQGSALPALDLSTGMAASLDTGALFYGLSSLKVVSVAAGTLAFDGFPIVMPAAQRWFCSWQIYTPNALTGTLTVTTDGGNSISETFSIPSGQGALVTDAVLQNITDDLGDFIVGTDWQQVWGLYDLRPYTATHCTWKFTFDQAATFWIDGLQMAVGGMMYTQPIPFGNPQAHGSIDMLPDGSTYQRMPTANMDAARRGLIDFTQTGHIDKILDNIADGTTYARYKSAGLTGGLADPSLGGIQAKGSIPPIVLGASISWTTTSGALALSWGAFTIYRPDGTTTTISTGSQSITGLTNGTTYTIYPYIVEGQTTLSFATGKTGSAGTPAICYAGGSGPAAAACYANANIPLQSFLAAPSAGGGGGGGNATGCLHPDTLVRLADGRTVPAEELGLDELMGPDGPARITHLSRQDCGEWVRVRFTHGTHATVTTDHRFLRPDGEQVRAADLHVGGIIAGHGRNVEVEALELIREKAAMVMVNVEYPHLYYLAGALSHNGNPKP